MRLPCYDETSVANKKPLSEKTDKGFLLVDSLKSIVQSYFQLSTLNFQPGSLHHTAHAAAAHWWHAAFFVFRLISQYTFCC
jgi:hypothetical protein